MVATFTSIFNAFMFWLNMNFKIVLLCSLEVTVITWKSDIFMNRFYVFIDGSLICKESVTVYLRTLEFGVIGNNILTFSNNLFGNSHWFRKRFFGFLLEFIYWFYWIYLCIGLNILTLICCLFVVFVQCSYFQTLSYCKKFIYPFLITLGFTKIKNSTMDWISAECMPLK